MEYLKNIISINNSNNVTTIKIITNIKEVILKLPYTIVTHPKGTTYKYSLNIIDYCNIHNISTSKYLYGVSWEV